MTPAFRSALLWIVGSALMIVATLSQMSAAYADGHYLPSNMDAFYHARRILDSVMSGAPIAQFDAHIHVPEGSWITWPWAFDATLATIVGWFGPYANENQAMAVLAYVPVALTPIVIAMALVIARMLRLAFASSLVLVVFFAVLPVTYMSFGIGNVDHHFAETLWALFAIGGSMWWLSSRESYFPPVVVGIALGTAIGVQNGLFILQLPVALLLVFRWMRGEPLPARRSLLAFSGALIVTTLLMCLPSQPFQRNFFEFYTLSWFHLYIACCTGVFVAALAFVPFSRARLALYAVAALAALIPIAKSLGLAGEFVSGDLSTIQNIDEANSPYALFFKYGAGYSLRFYSHLLWLTPLAVCMYLYLAFRPRDAAQQVFAVFGAFGLVLLQLQYRFHPFGSLAMLVAPLIAFEWACARWQVPPLRAALLLPLGFLIAFYPVKNNWNLYWKLGGKTEYAAIRTVFPVMRDACARAPGVMLADTDDGHWIRYHSKCDVIGNVFLLTALHERKLLETYRLLNLTPDQLVRDPVPVRYVLVHHSVYMPPPAVKGGPDPVDLEPWRQRMPAIDRDLLGPLGALPRQYKVLWDAKTAGGQTYGRLFEIVRETP